MLQIFILEDNREIAKNLTRLLRTEGYGVTCGSTISDALTILFENRFDLALLDISLPDGNGFTVCTEIKDKYTVNKLGRENIIDALRDAMA